MMGPYKKFLSAGLALCLLVCLGCSDNPALRLRYEAEQKLAQAERALSRAQVSPQLVTPEMVTEIRRAFSETIDFSYDALGQTSPSTSPVEYRELQHIAFVATSHLSKLLYAERRYDEAIGALSHLLDQPNLPPDKVLATRINLGRALQSSGDWDSALVVYNSSLTEFYPPMDNSGEVLLALFNLPIQIFRITDYVNDDSAADRELSRAMAYYNRLIEEHPDTRLVPASRANLARLYEMTGQWQKEIDQLKLLVDTASASAESIRLKIADTYGLKLKKTRTALAMYDSLLAGIEPTDTIAYPLLQNKIAMMWMEEGKYTAARDLLQRLKRDFRGFYGRNPLAQLAMARSFELENNWSRAEVEYNYLIENYRGSEEAMDAFLYVADKFKKDGRTAEAERWYEDAESYYKQMATAGAGGPLEGKAMLYQAELARIRGDLTGAAETLTKLFDIFPDTEPGRRALVKASLIYRRDLGQPDVADSLIDILRAAVADLLPETET